MNIVDLVIFIILGLFVLVGMYKGFVRSCMNVLAYICTIIVTFLIYPLFAKLMFLNDKLVKNFRFYAEGTEKLANLEQASLEVSALTNEQIKQIVEDSVAKVSGGLRAPMDSKVMSNLTRQSFEGEFTTVGEYFNETIVQYGVNVICFILLFFAIKIVVNIVLSMYDNSDAIPRLRQWDTVLGGVVGFLEGVLIFYVVFSIVPLIYNIMTIKPVEEILASSMTGGIFIDGNLIPRLIRAVV